MSPQRGLDAIGWFIATSHQLLGHDKAAMIAGQPSGGDKAVCLICQYEADPTYERRRAVIAALQPTAVTP